jgi:hypothetical protein
MEDSATVDVPQRSQSWGPRRAAVLQLCLVLGVVVAVWSPFLRAKLVDNGYADWSARNDYLGYTLNALRQDRQFPFWVTDPRFEQLRVKGAHDLFANPETDVLSVVTLVAAWSDLLTGVKVALLAFLALGVYGCRRLLQSLVGRAGLLPTLVLALLALCNGSLAGHVLIGHANILTLAYFPLVLALLLEAFDASRPAPDRVRRAAFAGALLAVAYYAGNTHYLFQFLLTFVALWPLLTFLHRPREWRASLGSAAVAGFSFIGLAAFKLFPGIEDFGRYHTDYLVNFTSLRHFFGYFVKPYSLTGENMSHEYLMYVGWGGVPLLAVGLLGFFDRRVRPLLLSVAIVAPIMFLRSGSRVLELPFLRTQGALTRFNLQLLLALAIASAFQVARLDAWLGQKRRPWIGRSVLIALALLFAFDLSRANIVRQVKDGCRTPMPAAVGPFDQAPLIGTPPGVVGGVVTAPNVHANSFSYDYSLPRPGLLVATELKASPRPHLSIEGDGELTNFRDHLAVRVRKRTGTFWLGFHDPVVDWSLWLSMLSALGVAVLGWRGRSRSV